MSDDSFANHPKSLAEVRSDRSQDGADWTPRDVLINMLRDIDSGELEPSALAVVWCRIDGTKSSSSYSISSPNAIVSLGMMERAYHRMNHAMDLASD